ncbi:MAG TPA: hypothetical protein PK141_05205 [Polyangiaceae bacterium]|nr:hypothetical protein [Polyangiaceae bacterium]
MRWVRWVSCSGIATAWLTLGSIAFAAPPSKEQCINAYQGAQVDMKQSALGAAREKLGVCLSDGCPRTLQADCAGWLKEVDARRPSIVLSFKGRDGTDQTRVPATIDGRPSGARTDGRAFDLDPGEHTFVFQPPGEPPVTVKQIVREGEKSQRVAAISTLARTSAPATPAPRDPGREAPHTATSVERPVPWTVYALGGLGLVGAGAFVGFGVSGASGKSGLEACKPSCLDSDVSSVRTRFIVADVSLAVGVLALAGALTLYLTRPEITRPGRAVVTRDTRPSWLESAVRGEF